MDFEDNILEFSSAVPASPGCPENKKIISCIENERIFDSSFDSIYPKS
jgi:hypothetical protein